MRFHKLCYESSFFIEDCNMVSAVPSLEGSLFLTEPQSIIAYQLRKYFRTPKDTIPIVGDSIISLPWQVARFGKEPDTLVANMQSDLQKVFERIFTNERKISVSVTHTPNGDGAYDVNLTVMYTALSGELNQIGTTISLVKGRLVIPEDTLKMDIIPL